MNKINQFVKSKLPSKLFYRFILIVLLPMFTMQTVSLYIFFHRYLNITSKQNIDILSTEVFILNNRFDKQIEENNDVNFIIDDLNIFTNIKIIFIKDQSIDDNTVKYNNHTNFLFNNPLEQLENELYILNSGKTKLYKADNYNYNIEIEKNDGILRFTVNKNRIFVHRIDLIIFWNILSFIIMGSVALLYIKNQVKSILKLRTFANEFSYLEKDNSNFKPTGAEEIRETGVAFLNVVKKMKSLINMRTTMLAQISHDLRTPLTRMKLQTEFLDNKEIANFFKQDLEEMEKLINEYLLFAKGENADDFKKVQLKTFFNNIISDYSRSGYNNIKINYKLKTFDICLKVDSFKRCINNLLNNAIKYAKRNIEIFVVSNDKILTIIIEDDGNGISEELFNKIELIFYKAANSKTDGVGLGLFIVKNIVNMHKGKIYFSKSKKLGGLNVKLTIPIINNNKKWSNKNVKDY